MPKDFDINYLGRGNVMCDPNHPIPFVKKFVAKVMVFSAPLGVVTKGDQVTVHCYTSKSHGRISSLCEIIELTFNKETNTSENKSIKKNPKTLKPSDKQLAVIKITLNDRMNMELFKNY